MRVLEATANLAADLGHRVEEADPTIDGEAIVPTFLTLMGVNTVVNLSSHPSAGRAAREDEVERITWLTAKLGEAKSGADYVRATQTMHRLGRQMAAFHDDHDILLTPGLATGTAVPLGWLDMMMDDLDEYWRRVFHFSPFTVWFNLTGQPAVMLPIGKATTACPSRCRRSPPMATRRCCSGSPPSSSPHVPGSTESPRWWARRLIRNLRDARFGVVSARPRDAFPDRSVAPVAGEEVDPRRPGARSRFMHGRPTGTTPRGPGTAGGVLANAVPSRAKRKRGETNQPFRLSNPSSPAKGRWVASSEVGATS